MVHVKCGSHICHAHAQPPKQRLGPIPDLLSRFHIFRSLFSELEAFDYNLQRKV